MATKKNAPAKPKDSDFVSAQPAEINRVAKRFISLKTGEHPPKILIHLLQITMASNKGKANRGNMHKALGLLGFTVDKNSRQ